MASAPRPPGIRALRIAAIYAVLSAAWILCSDQAVHRLIADPDLRTTVEIAKGWGFVAVTAVMLWLLVRGALAREQAEAAERGRAQARERMAFEASRDALYVFPMTADGAPGRFEAVNDEACRRLGRSRAEMLALGPADINPAPRHPDMRAKFALLRAEGMVLLETEHLVAGGGTIPVEVAARMVEIDGRLLVVSAARDLTQRKVEQARLVDAERMAAIGLLAGGLAHEFNNLHAIAVGHLEFVERGGDPEAQRHAHSALTALERAAALTRSLLDFARPDQGQRRSERLDLVVAETLGLVRGQFIADGVEVDASGCVEVPAVAMDRNQIGQAVMNLLINAVHAMEGRPQRRLGLATWRADGRVGVSVSDSGCGIAAAEIDRIFLPFFTSKGAGPLGGAAPRGRGLGLSITKAMVEAHGGGLEVVSAPGQGSLFKLWLPITD